MNWKVEEAIECLDDVYSPNSYILDGKIVTEENLDQFLRIVCQAKNRNQRNALFKKEFLLGFLKDSENVVSTIAYFIQDNFFIPIIGFLNDIDNKDLEAWLEYESGRNQSISPWFRLSYVNEKYRDEPRYSPDSFDVYPADKVRADLLEIMINRSYYFFDNKYKDETFSKFAKRHKKGLIAYPIDLDNLYYLYLTSELVELVGFQVFEIKSLHESVMYCEENGLDDLLIKVSNNLFFGSRNRKQQNKYFIFALCEKLKQKHFGTRETFRVVGNYLFNESSSVHRRYYEIQKELKAKNYSIDEIIRTYKLERKLRKALNDIVPEKFN